MPQRFLRLDAEFSNTQETPQGGRIFQARLTRSGVFVYRNPDGSIVREYRPPSEVFSADSLATLQTAPVTREHPGVVTAQNFRSVSRGNVLFGSVQREGDFAVGALVIQDSELLGDIDSGERTEISLGYQMVAVDTPGVTPEGEEYDRVQTSIKNNHVAVTKQGRAGPEVCLRLDAAGDCVDDTGDDSPPEFKGIFRGEQDMKSIVIGGVTYPLTTPAEIEAAQKALERESARMDSISGTKDGEISAMKIRAEKAEAEVKRLLEVNRKLARFDAEDMALIKKATAVMGADYSAEGKTSEEIMREVVAKAFPDRPLDGKSLDYISGLFDSIKVEGNSDAEKPAEEKSAEEKPTEQKQDSKGSNNLGAVNKALGGALPNKPQVPAITPQQEYSNKLYAMGREPLNK